MELGNIVFGHRSREHEIPRNAGFETELKRLFDVLSPLDYGYEFENRVFIIHPYWWGDCTCGAEEHGEEDHLPTCRYMLPNFIYIPTGFELEWYKYPLRDSYSNFKISLIQFAKMIDECIASLDKE